MERWSQAQPSARVLASPMRHGVARFSARASMNTPGGLGGLSGNLKVRILTTAAGERVRVVVSTTFAETPENEAAVRSYVDFLSSRLHGTEIERVVSILAPLREVQAVCGAAALACYEINRQWLITPADGTPRGEVSKEVVATHEYGHHVARNRNNYPWKAVDFGPKRWSRLHRICSRVSAGSLWPGNEERHYFKNPGEGWAHAYARYHYPRIYWRYSPLMRPVAATARVVRTDVLVPWQRAGTWVQRGRLASGGSARRSFATPLDGRVVVHLSGPRSADFALESVGGRAVRVTRRPGSQEVLVAPVCGTSRLTVRVRALRGGGRYTLVARIP